MIRMKAEDLMDMLNSASQAGMEIGSAQVERRVQESTKALLAENNKLKSELRQILKIGQEGGARKLYEESLGSIVALVLKGGVL